MAQYNLGQMYLLGQGIPPDRDLAVQWFDKAAKQGFEPAKKKLHSLGLNG
ncbi:MAG: SEL1-like repeat protein [Deltaproteobacteria bacterium]|nr:SEL1-like repeat protein [Deltaproteobacteria bacterium]